MLKEHQAGIAVADLCRKHGISDATFYNWRIRYGGMEVGEGPTRLAIGRVRLRSLARVGFSIGWVISLLPALREKGYAGPVIALDDPARPVAADALAEGLSLQTLVKPLAMRQVFQAVERALAPATH